MSNRTYICTACRTARRAEAWHGMPSPLRCPLCRGSLWELSRKWRIPAKTNDKGWRELERIVAEQTPLRAAALRERGHRLLRQLDDKLGKLKTQNSKGRNDARIAALQSQRDKVLATYFAPESA